VLKSAFISVSVSGTIKELALNKLNLKLVSVTGGSGARIVEGSTENILF
jgi:hypothetical protein